jgi:Cys-rich protein (TIGR01571 family)
MAYNEAAVTGNPCGISECCGAFFCGPLHIMAVRTAIRTKYGFDGSICGDIVAITFCAPCAICQHTRQLDIKGAAPAGMCMS